MGATTESKHTDYTSKLTDHVDRRVTDEYIVLFSITDLKLYIELEVF
jgi:hypothetical protein